MKPQALLRGERGDGEAVMPKLSLSPLMSTAPGVRIGAQPRPASVAAASKTPPRDSVIETEPSALSRIETATCSQTER
jgi:hypothetical protein